MKKTSKILVPETLREEIRFVGPLDEAIAELYLLRTTHGTTHENLRIECGGDYYESSSYYLVGERLETDEEFAKRLKKEAQTEEAARIRKLKRIEKFKKEAGELGFKISSH